MPILYDSVLTAALGHELATRWTGQGLEAVNLDRDERVIRLAFEEREWTWLLHPTLGVLTSRAVGPRRGRRKDRGILSGRVHVERVAVDADSRRLQLELTSGPETDSDRISIDLAANRRNVSRVSSGGSTVPDPAGGRLWTSAAPDLAEWLAHLARHADQDHVPRIAFLSGINRDFVFGASGEHAPAEAYAAYAEIRTAAAAGDSSGGWLIPTAAGWQPYPHSLARPDAIETGSLLAAMDRCTQLDKELGEAVERANLDPHLLAARDALFRRRDRAARKQRTMRRQLEIGSEAPGLRGFADLLLARKLEVRPGLETVELEDFEGGTVRIPLDPTLDAVGNAEAYYRKARRLDRAAGALPERIAEAKRAIERFDDALAELERTGVTEDVRAAAGIGNERAPARDRERARLPYRCYRTSGGLEVRAGRSARDNDNLTFRHSSPDDIWMHVRQSPGAHVVLRWNRRDQNPPESDLREAAVIAASLSRARGSGLVPVSWTRRKYVRKPRKSGPGTVTTERTQTLFVEPDPGLVDRLAGNEG